MLLKVGLTFAKVVSLLHCISHNVPIFQKIERREKIEQIVRERERQRMEVYQRKWSRREEADFFRTISTYGVEFDRLVVYVEYSKCILFEDGCVLRCCTMWCVRY